MIHFRLIVRTEYNMVRILLQVCTSFDEMNINQKLLRGIYAYGFEKPSAIQQRAIIPCISKRDVIAQAQSGTGKTATFSIAILEQIDPTIKICQALILAPTRELAQQVNRRRNIIKYNCRVVNVDR